MTVNAAARPPCSGFYKTASLDSHVRHNGCSQKIGDLPLANVDYVGGEQLPHRATTKEAGHEREYHFCRS
jgi:hypothetical protein